MVSLWPWGREDTSPASFEKTLSLLSQQINDTAAQLDSRRQRARRFKALWTLYSSFTYLLCLMLEAVVVGWRNWGPKEYTSLAGAPLIIVLIRMALSSFYDYRISSLQQYLATLQTRREKTIAKLKAATRYESTHELLEKYGGTEKKKSVNKNKNPSKGGEDNENQTAKKHKQQQQGQRTSFIPPPTANIPGRNPMPIPLQQAPSPNQQSTPSRPAPSPPNYTESPTSASASASFAPNAFPSPPSYNSAPQSSAWYDRLLDVLLGEDETSARSRLALICSSCHLVNGLAPPGATTPEEVGLWRCSGCGSMNGEESSDRKVLKEIERGSRLSDKEIHEKLASVPSPTSPADGNTKARLDESEVLGLEEQESDRTIYSEDEEGVVVKDSEGEDEDEEEAEEELEPVKPKRGRPKKGSKKG